MAQVLGLNFKTIRLGSCLYDQWLKEKRCFDEQLNALTYDGELLSSEVSAGDFLDHLLDVHRRLCRVCNCTLALTNRCGHGLNNSKRVVDLGPSQTDHSPRSGHSDQTLSDVRSPAIQHDSPLIGHSKPGEEVSISSEEDVAAECLTDASTTTRECQSVAQGETSNMEASLSNQLDGDDSAVLDSGLVKSELTWDQDIIISKERPCQEEEKRSSTSVPEQSHSHTGPWVCETVSDPHLVSSAQHGTSQPVPDLLTRENSDEGLPAEDGGNVSRQGPRFSCWDCGQIFEDVADLRQHCAHGSCHRQRALLRLNHSSYHRLSSSTARDAAVEVVSSDIEQLQDENLDGQQLTSPTNVLTCNLCGKVFMHQISFDIHMKVHQSTDAHVCQACGSTFSDADKLERHTRNGCLYFPCPACSKRFKYRNSLYKHVTSKHRSYQAASGFGTSVGIPELSAVVERSQPNQWPAAEPARQHLENSPSLESSSPEMYAGAAAALQRQSSSLGPDGPALPAPNTFPTEWTGPSEQPQVPNENHMHKHVCDICNKVFGQSNNLKRHRRIHTNERPYKCNICFRAFAQSNTLKEHKHIHSNHRGYCCNACGKCFRQRSSMDKHKKASSIHGILECSRCGMRFANKCTLKVHMASHMFKVV